MLLGSAEIRSPLIQAGLRFRHSSGRPVQRRRDRSRQDSGARRLTIQGVKDCAPLGTGLPLVLISHGMYGDAFSHHDTAEFLADAGFAVVTLNHTLDSAYSCKDISRQHLVFPCPARDIRRVIDFLLSNSQRVRRHRLATDRVLRLFAWRLHRIGSSGRSSKLPRATISMSRRIFDVQTDTR